MKTLTTLQTKMRAIGTGISACGPGNFIDAVRTAAAQRRAGTVGFVYVWRKGVLDWGPVARQRPAAKTPRAA